VSGVRIIKECGTVTGMKIGRGKSNRRRQVPVPLFPPQISHMT
jgi:hypothetical protein